MTWYHPALAPRTINALDDEIAKLRAENERLRQGIADYIAGNFGPRTGKTEQCSHGRYGYEDCPGCTVEHFMKVLGVGPQKSMPPKCDGCGTNYADPPSKLCPGCQAYQDHQH